MMRISVAMATYNGAKYVGEQLDSILSQHRPPDELVICDDSSSDTSIQALEAVAKDAPFPIVILHNDGRLGSIATFEKAIKACSGDIIALSDQDDVWLPEKLATLERKFAADEAVGLLFTDAVVVDESLSPLGYGLWRSVGFNRHLQQWLRSSKAADLILSRPFVTGATLAFRSKWRPLILPFPPDLPYFIHDRWAATLIGAVSKVDFIERPLIRYRQHGNQQIGARRQSILQRVTRRFHTVKDNIQDDLRALDAIEARLEVHPELPVHDAFREALATRRMHLDARVRLPANRFGRVTPIASELASGRYGRCSRGPLSAAKDLIL